MITFDDYRIDGRVNINKAMEDEVIIYDEDEQRDLLTEIGTDFFKTELEEKFYELQNEYSRKNYYLKK